MLTVLIWAAYPASVGLAVLAVCHGAARTNPALQQGHQANPPLTINPEGKNRAQMAGVECANCNKRWPSPEFRVGLWPGGGWALCCPDCAQSVRFAILNAQQANCSARPTPTDDHDDDCFCDDTEQCDHVDVERWRPL